MSSQSFQRLVDMLLGYQMCTNGLHQGLPLYINTHLAYDHKVSTTHPGTRRPFYSNQPLMRAPGNHRFTCRFSYWPHTGKRR